MANKVRIYDLAKELKLESKKVVDDARAMGVDVSVPSNSVDDVIAARIREKYYPKKEQATATHRARLIKHPPATAPTASTTAEASSVPDAVEAGAVVEPPVGPPTTESEVLPAVTAVTPVQPEPTTRVVQLRPVAPAAPVPAPPVSATPVPTVEVETPAVPEPVAVEEPLPEPEVVKPEPAPSIPGVRVSRIMPPAPRPVEAPPAPVAASSLAPPDAPPAVVEVQNEPEVKPPAPPPPGGTVVRKLTPPTRPMPTPPPAPPRGRAPGGAPSGRPGETTRFDRPPQSREPGREAPGRNVHILPSGAQQVKVYIPPKDQRPQGRHQKRKEQEGHQKNLPRKQVGGHQPSVPVPAVPAELKPIRLIEGSTVREFAEKIQAKPRDLVTQLMQRGVMATINQTIKPEMAVELGRQYGWEVSFGDFEDMVIESEFEITPEAMEDTDPRAPIITVMGHVDHGKTSLLDAIRSARVAEGEAGGITQHIGAYSVEVADPENADQLRRVVFLDTPGHEAFTMMRARGARVTDIVVLVVAADDGVMPQTVEAIEHARAAGVPIIVAINKIDKPDANPDRVRKELADRGLLWTSWSGDTEMVEVSARNRLNIDGLLEMILLTADIIELRANPKRRATGTVLEAKLDRGRGAVATVLVQNGSLHVGDPFIVGNFFGKVRALMNDRGERVEEVGPAMPVEVLGLEGVPSAGDQFQVVDEISKAQQISSYRQTHARAAALARSAARGLDQLRTQLEAGRVRELLVILKTDVQGSVEVLKDTLLKLSTDKVKVRIIRSDVGAITESDVLLASASQATESGAVTVIIGFNVRPETRAEEVARQESVDIRLHSIIYKVEEEIRSAMLGLMEATSKETIIGKAEIRDIIRVPKVGTVAGCMVINGQIKRTAKARLIRNNVVIFESQIGSLRRFKDDVSEVQQGYECGLTVDRFNDYKMGDIVEAYLIEKVAPTEL
ncbi:MAG: translation initiation factor IF-2 [Blastocatellia bacterium]